MDDSLTVLTGPDAGGLLAAAVGTAGGRLLTWRATQVDHRPDRSTTVTYTARVAWGDVERKETLGASTGIATDRDRPGVLVLSDGALDVAVWRHPLDPGLPALAAASDPASVRDLLVELGFADPRSVPDDIALTSRAYRPRRRAVVEARFPSAGAGPARLFLKVARPQAVADLHRRHRLLRDAGVVVPEPLGWTDDGLLVLTPLRGRCLRVALQEQGPAAVRAQDLVAALDALPSALLALPAKPAWSDGAGFYAGVLAAALPAQATRAHELAHAVRDALAGANEAVVPAHGDFYEGQLFADGGRLSGVLDVDAAGPGRRSDDFACILAHAEVLAQIARHRGDHAAAAHLRAAVESWLPVLDADPLTDPRTTRVRAAGVLLSLATGPHRVQQEGWEQHTSTRLDLVERWLALAENPLMPVS